MEYTIEYLKEDEIVMSGIGALKKGIKLICTKAVAEEFRNDTRFKVSGLESPKPVITKTKKKEE